MKIVDQESVNIFIHHLPDLFVVSLIIVLSSHDKNAQLQYLTFFYLIKMPLPAIIFMMIDMKARSSKIYFERAGNNSLHTLQTLVCYRITFYTI